MNRSAADFYKKNNQNNVIGLHKDEMSKSSKPNIVFILTDDQGYWAMGCAGNEEVKTPNIDRIAANGIRFENFFCASPVCSPARASILTGLMPSQHGIHDWLRKGNLRAVEGLPVFMDDDCSYEYLQGLVGYTDYLASAGYSCGLSGKWHLGDSLHPQKGYSYWNVFPYGGSNHYYNPVMIQKGQILKVSGYLTDVITEGAVEFIQSSSTKETPFYLGVHYTAPHSPWEKGQHPKDFTSLYDDCPFVSCPDLPAHPWQMNSAPRGTGEVRRELLTGYYAAISAMDAGVGRILDELEKNRLVENTLIIFGSDNGMNMGHHGIWGKGNGTFPQNMFDTSVKVPFIMSCPGKIPSGLVDQELRSHYDIFPTLLDYCEIPFSPDHPMPGTSFADLLRGRSSASNDVVVVFDEYGPVRMIRSKKWKYVHRYPYGPNEFYNLIQDPGEENNLIDDTESQSVIEQYRASLEEWFITYSNPDLDGTKAGVYGKGQIEFVGKRGKGKSAFVGDWFYIDSNGIKTKRDK